MMLCVPMFVGAQTLTFTDHEPMGNIRTQVTRQFFRFVEQESKGRIRIDHHWNGELSSSYDAYETVREGTKDMATVVPEYDSQRMPLHQLFKSFLSAYSTFFNYLHFSFAILMFFDGKDPRFCLSLYHIFSVFLTSALHSGCDG